MLVTAMSRMMESMAPSSVQVLEPPKPRQVAGLADKVYDQMRREFFVAGPFVLHAEVPVLLAASWSLVRETLFVGVAPRAEKELIAVGVSEANRCPFCIDAHSAAVRSTGVDGVEPNVAVPTSLWALATGQSGHPDLSSPPFATRPVEYPPAECLGTVVAFHYLNRMVSAFLDDKMMPMPSAFDSATMSMATIMMGGMIAKAESNVAGESIALVPEADPSLAWRPQWAEASPTIAEALARWSSAIETEARRRLDSDILSAIADGIESWTDVTADPKPIVDQLGDRVTGASRTAARVGVSIAAAPYRVSEEELRSVTAAGWSNEDLLVLVAWSAQRAARRVGTWTAEAAGL